MRAVSVKTTKKRTGFIENFSRIQAPVKMMGEEAPPKKKRVWDLRNAL